jgi:hypothetical protein
MEDWIKCAAHVADPGDAVGEEEWKYEIRAIGSGAVEVDVSVHIPQAWDEIFAASVDDLSGRRVKSGSARNPGDPIAVNDYGCVGLDCPVNGVDNFGVGNGKSLRLNVKCQQGQGE